MSETVSMTQFLQISRDILEEPMLRNKVYKWRIYYFFKIILFYGFTNTCLYSFIYLFTYFSVMDLLGTVDIICRVKSDKTVLKRILTPYNMLITRQ